MAVAPTEEVKEVLVAHWPAYPTGGGVLLDEAQEGMVTYEWRRKVCIYVLCVHIVCWMEYDDTDKTTANISKYD